MAAAWRSEALCLLRVPSAVQLVSLRWKKPPKWRDPNDLSWMQPLMEKRMKETERQNRGEPEQAPAMLHMMTRIRQLGGRPYWEKDTIKALGLEQRNVPVVHKNAPNINKMLSSIKHLIKIVPVTFPHGLPQSESDFQHCVLHADGRLEVKKTLQPLEKCLTSQEDEKDKVWKMNSETVERATRRVLEQFSLSREFFPAKYIYKYNQDGKEYRYFGDQNNTRDKGDWY